MRSQTRIPPADMRFSLSGLIALYSSKVSAIIFGVLIIPFYGKLTDEIVFGQISLSLTLVAMCLMFDFGIATVVARRLALKNKFDLSELLSGLAALGFVYSSFAIILTLVSLVIGFEISLLHITVWGYIFLFVANNIIFMSLSAVRSYSLASLHLTLGLVLRASMTLFLITYFEASIENFSLGMLLAGLLQSVLSIVLVTLRMDLNCDLTENFKPFDNILRNGAPLIIVGLSGSLMLSFDKIAIAQYVSVEELGPYFLATTLAVLPINLFAVPLLQYFQPRITNQVSSKTGSKAVLFQFSLMSLIFCVVPSIILYLFLPSVIDVWLGDVSYKLEVLKFSEILLPFTIIGALGVIPLAVITALGEFELQAKVSLLLTILFMVSILIVARYSSIILIIYVVCSLHFASSVVFLPRLIRFLDNKHA